MKISILLSILTLCSCSSKTNKNKKNESQIVVTEQISDTLIGKKPITNEIAGSSYRKRAIGYFTIVKKDTSRFMPIFSESQNDGEITIDQNLVYSNKTKTYFQRLGELKLICGKQLKNLI